MLVLVALACLAVPLVAWNYPNPTLDNGRDGLEFSLSHVPVIKRVFFKYATTNNGEENASNIGPAVRLGKHWRFHDKQIGSDLSYGDEIKFNVVIWTAHGKEESPVLSWIWAPQAVIHSRPLRQAVIFRDDFNGGFDKGQWHTEISMFGGYNWEFQVYTPEAKNVYTQGGSLYLKPTLTVDDPRWDENFLTHGHMDVAQIWGTCTESGNYGCARDGAYGMLPPIMSGRVVSAPTLRFGVAEIRAKPPKGDWIWPAIWMMPKASRYGTWPRSGEIDIMETRGNAVARTGNDNHGINEVSSTLHWGSNSNDNHFMQTHAEKRLSNGDWHSDFHTWRLEWTPDHLITSVDNQEILRVTPPGGGFHELGHMGENPWGGASKMAPFDQDFFLILNVAVGGTSGFFPDNFDYGVQKPWVNPSTHANADFWARRGDWQRTWVGDNVAMLVDYVEFRHN